MTLYQSATVLKASTSVKGVVELATTSEVTAGSDTERVPSVSTMKNHYGVAKAWVNFNGTGTVAIRSSYNVSSITDNGTGDYTVNFLTSMADANYSVAGSCCQAFSSASWGFIVGPYTDAPTASAVRLVTNAGGGGKQDCIHINIAIYGN